MTKQAAPWRIEAAAAGMQAALAVAFVAAFVAHGWGSVPRRVIDGDTFVTVLGEHVRPLGFDTPETKKPRCLNEKRQGRHSTARLVAALNAARDVRIVRCGEYDRDWRTLARVFIDGRDLAEIAVKGGWGLPAKPEGGWCQLLQSRPRP